MNSTRISHELDTASTLMRHEFDTTGDQHKSATSSSLWERRVLALQTWHGVLHWLRAVRCLVLPLNAALTLHMRILGAAPCVIGAGYRMRSWPTTKARTGASAHAPRRRGREAVPTMPWNAE